MDYSHMFGLVFSELTVTGQSGEKDRLVCVCSCGSTKIARLSHLRAGTVKSCGCLLRKRPKEVHGTYLASRTSEYKIWDSMIRRCHQETHHAYSNYGSRGIHVCDRWRGANGFGNFREDMGRKPPGKSLDRIDNSLGYFKENCRWAPPRVQCNNKRTNRILTARGQTRTLAEWSRLTGIGDTTITERLRRGWDVDSALHTSVRPVSTGRQLGAPTPY